MSTLVKTASISDSRTSQSASSASSTANPTSTASSAVSSSSISLNSCQPTGCIAVCTPSCSSDKICSLSTMQNCGECPPSQCVSKSALDLPNVSSPDVQFSSTSSGSKVGLIVGLTVGLVGGFLLLIVLFLCWRRRCRQRSDKQSLILPTNTSDISGHQPTLSTNSAHQDPRALDSDYDYSEKSAMPIVSTPDHSAQSASVAATEMITKDGGISRSLSLKTNAPHNLAAGVTRSSSMRVTRNEMRQEQKRLSDNPFDDLEDESKVVLRRAVSVKKSQRYPKNKLQSADITDKRPKSEVLCHPERESVISIYSATPAIQVMRAKPMVVRVDSLKGRDGRITRKTSQRALSSSKSESQDASATEDNPTSHLKPSSDRNSKSLSTVSAQSRSSQNMDGEITIFWDNDSKPSNSAAESPTAGAANSKSDISEGVNQ